MVYVKCYLIELKLFPDSAYLISRRTGKFAGFSNKMAIREFFKTIYI